MQFRNPFRRKPTTVAAPTNSDVREIIDGVLVVHSNRRATYADILASLPKPAPIEPEPVRTSPPTHEEIIRSATPSDVLALADRAAAAGFDVRPEYGPGIHGRRWMVCVNGSLWMYAEDAKRSGYIS